MFSNPLSKIEMLKQILIIENFLNQNFYKHQL